jgi:L-iditol 2-dehydrogenase
MIALVKYGQQPGMVELREVPEPVAGPGTVLIEVRAAAICGWDIEMWQHSMANPVTVPVIQGHEFCGTVAALGPGVDGWVPGERVACETSAQVCGTCFWCRQGEYQICPARKGYGYGVDGAFTRYVVARPAILHRIPENLSFEDASLTEPFCVAHHALADRITIRPGDRAVIIGPGPIGLICLQMARLLGATQTALIGLGTDSARLDLAAQMGWADRIIRADQEDAGATVAAWTDGRGADIVADCAGNAAALATALATVRRGGQIVKIGWGPKPVNQSLDDLLRKSATLAGTFGHRRANWEAVLGAFAGRRLNPGALITSVMPLRQWHDAFTRIHGGQAVKIVLTPERD